MKTRQTPRRRAMANYYRFSIFNVISFSFLAGNIIILYALRFGAGNVLVGIIAASYQVTFMFSLIGRTLISRFGAVRLFGYFWAIRYLAMAPVLLTAVPSIRSHPNLVLAIVTICAFGFNVSKGIGITATKPIVGEIPPQRERGSFLSNQQLIMNLGAIGTGLIMAWLLGPQSELGRYLLLLVIGIAAGFMASYFILRLPEPEAAGEGFDARFRDGLKSAMHNRTFRRLSLVNMMVVFASAMAESFLLVYFKQVYGYGDQSVVIFIVAGSVGAATMAIISRSVIDRTGAKPLLFTFATVLGLVLVPVAMAPSLSGAWVGLFPALIYFFFSMGRAGIFTAADSYFFSITQAEARLDSGIVYGISGGVAGALGSIVGGLFLTGLQRLLPAHTTLPFSIYFGIAAGVALLAVSVILKLEDVDSLPIPDALGMLVSPRDLRAIRLLNRLRRSRTEPEEQKAVRALRQSSSTLAVDELSNRIQSPSLLIRMEALGALRGMPLTREVEDLLMADVRNHSFTTAQLAVELLGAARVRRAIPLLRESVVSSDYLVSAKAMLALAQLDDRKSIRRLESQLETTPNARVAIYAVKALETLGSIRSLPLILRALSRTREPFQRDEYILSCARLLGFFDWFYALYLEFLDEPREGLRSLVDTAAETSASTEALASEFAASFSSDGPQLRTLIEPYLGNREITVARNNIASVLRESLADDTLLSLERYRFLLLATFIALDRTSQGGAVVYNRR
jgi:MFS family permease